MEIYLDTANLNEIKKAIDLNIISGITTNPTLIAREMKRLEILGQPISSEDVINDILYEFDGPVHVETTKSECDEIVQDSNHLYELFGNDIVVKIPVTYQGLKAIQLLTNGMIETNAMMTNATLVFSVNQAILAAKAGADYVSIFVGRIDDIGYNGTDVVKDTVNIFRTYDIDTEIIAASIRSPLHVAEAAKAGVDICTIPFNIMEKMIEHPLTTQGIEKFNKECNN